MTRVGHASAHHVRLRTCHSGVLTEYDFAGGFHHTTAGIFLGDRPTARCCNIALQKCLESSHYILLDELMMTCPESNMSGKAWCKILVSCHHCKQLLASCRLGGGSEIAEWHHDRGARPSLDARHSPHCSSILWRASISHKTLQLYTPCQGGWSFVGQGIDKASKSPWIFRRA